MSSWTSEDPGHCNLEELSVTRSALNQQVEMYTAAGQTVTASATQSTSSWLGTAGDGWRGKASAEAAHLLTSATMFDEAGTATNQYYASVASIQERAEPLRVRLDEVRNELASGRWTHCTPLFRYAKKNTPRPPLLELPDCSQYDVLVEEELALISTLHSLADERTTADAAIVSALQSCVPPGVTALRLALQRSKITIDGSFNATSLKDALLEQAATIGGGDLTDAEIDAFATLLGELDDPSGIVASLVTHLGNDWMLTLASRIQQRCADPSATAIPIAGGLLALVANLPETLLESLSKSHPEVFDSIIGVTDYPKVDLETLEAWQTKVSSIWVATDIEQQQRLTKHASALIGNLNGIPFETRYAANRENVSRAIDEIKKQLEADPSNSDLRIKRSFYESLLGRVDLEDGRGPISRQILLFDPRGNGRFAQVYGDLSTATNIGTLLGGTNTDMLGNRGMADKWASEFYREGYKNHLAMISWMGTDFPKWSTTDSPAEKRFAVDAAARLAGFSVALQHQVERFADLNGTLPVTTFAGHSYGGAMLGAAEQLGLLTDRTLYVESAGGGPGALNTFDYNDPSIKRFATMAPGDPVGLIDSPTYYRYDFPQSAPPLGVGPRHMFDVQNLDTGNYADGTTITGGSSHNGVFDKDSDAKNRMLEVFTNSPYGSEGFNE